MTSLPCFGARSLIGCFLTESFWLRDLPFGAFLVFFAMASDSITGVGSALVLVGGRLPPPGQSSGRRACSCAPRDSDRHRPRRMDRRGGRSDGAGRKDEHELVRFLADRGLSPLHWKTFSSAIDHHHDDAPHCQISKRCTGSAGNETSTMPEESGVQSTNVTCPAVSLIQIPHVLG